MITSVARTGGVSPCSRELALSEKSRGGVDRGTQARRVMFCSTAIKPLPRAHFVHRNGIVSETVALGVVRSDRCHLKRADSLINRTRDTRRLDTPHAALYQTRCFDTITSSRLCERTFVQP